MNILKLPQLEAKVGKKKSSIYAEIKAGTFPSPIFLSKRSVGWIESEIDLWLSERIQKSRNQGEAA